MDETLPELLKWLDEKSLSLEQQVGLLELSKTFLLNRYLSEEIEK